MFIYILNLLHDGLRKKNINNECSACEIIDDTRYISQLAGINKNYSFKKIYDNVINIFEVFNKYNLTAKDSMDILQKLIQNNNNSWILENIYKSYFVNSSDESELAYRSIIKDILENIKKGDEYMRINHLALWVNNIECMKDYYVKFFQGKAGEKYTNEKKGFSSYFISFDSGARLEIMSKKDVHFNEPNEYTKGYAHIAISVGSKEKVDTLTEKIRYAGYEVTSETRTTGDGYYESCVVDPEGNLIEITI